VTNATNQIAPPPIDPNNPREETELERITKLAEKNYKLLTSAVLYLDLPDPYV
jgi:hypothetical protein